jgi:hypothetical protein
MIMQNISIKIVVLLVCLSVVESLGCSPTLAPIYSPVEIAGIRRDGAPFTAQQIESAIILGAQEKGWAVISKVPGAVRAEIHVGDHYARVRITYNATSWQVLHEESSPSLEFQTDSTNGTTIHRRYNHWVRLLSESFRKALAYLTMGPMVTNAPPAAQNPPRSAPAAATPNAKPGANEQKTEGK